MQRDATSSDNTCKISTLLLIINSSTLNVCIILTGKKQSSSLLSPPSLISKKPPMVYALRRVFCRIFYGNGLPFLRILPRGNFSYQGDTNALKFEGHFTLWKGDSDSFETKDFRENKWPYGKGVILRVFLILRGNCTSAKLVLSCRDAQHKHFY